MVLSHKGGTHVNHAPKTQGHPAQDTTPTPSRQVIRAANRIADKAIQRVERAHGVKANREGQA